MRRDRPDFFCHSERSEESSFLLDWRELSSLARYPRTSRKR